MCDPLDLNDNRSETRISLRQKGLTWRAIDGGVAILDLERSVFYELNETAGFLWTIATQADQTLEELASQVAAEYSIDLDQAREDTSAFLDDLADLGFLGD